MKRLHAALVLSLVVWGTTGSGQTPSPTPPAPAASLAPAWKPFQELAFLLGAWSGTVESGGRVGGRIARFTMELGGAYLVHRGNTFLSAEDGKPEENMEEIGYFSYDREKRRYMATYFFSSGVSGVYDVEFSADGAVRLVSRDLRNYESGARVRMLLAKKSDAELSLSTDLAPAGKDFVPFVASILKKR